MSAGHFEVHHRPDFAIGGHSGRTHFELQFVGEQQEVKIG